MLKKIDQADIDKLDDEQRQHLMVNAEGEYVFAQADEKAWKRHLEQVEASKKAAQKVQAGDKELQDRGLECPIDKRLFVDPMKTPCCGKTYCHDCIENALLDNDLTCPGCQTENVSIEGLEPDEEVKAKIKEYQDEKNNDKQRSRSPTISIKSDGKASRTQSRDGSRTPASSAGKKRSADEANDNNLLAPTMKRQKSNEGSAVATPQPDTANDNPPTPATDTSTGQDNNSTDANSNINFPSNMMPPDVSQMQNMMNMGMMNPMMVAQMNMNPMMMQQMMNMGMINPMMMGMLGNNMNGMTAPPMMNDSTAFGNQGFGNQNGFQGQGHDSGFQPRGRGRGRGRGNFRGGSQQNHQQVTQQEPQEPKQPEGLSGVPTGPKALRNPPTGPAAGAGGFYPPTGPSNKFSNQQRYAGKEEDNAYMRQPVNPQRQWGRNRGRGKMREAEYKELGS
jgi:protein MPE1